MTEIRILRALFPREGQDVIEVQSGGELAWEEESDDEAEDEADDILPLTPPPENLSEADFVREEQPGRRGGSPAMIPIHWTSRILTRSMSAKAKMEEKEKTKMGRKRCLQLDLTSYGDEIEGEGAYHLGTPFFMLHSPSCLTLFHLSLSSNFTLHLLLLDRCVLTGGR